MGYMMGVVITIVTLIVLVMGCIADPMYLWVLLPALGLAIVVSLIKRKGKD